MLFQQSTGLFVADVLIDIFFLVDVFLRFEFEYIDDESSEVVSVREKSFSHHVKSGELKCGLLAIPSIVFSFLATYGYEFSYNFYLLRLSRSFFLKDLIRILKHYIVKEYGSVNESLLRMVLIFYCTVLMIITTACLYFNIACPNKVDCIEYSWAASDPLTTTSFVSRFVRATHFMTQTLMTIGFGDSVVCVQPHEIEFTCVFILMGLFLYSVILANLTSVLSNLNVVARRFRNEMEQAHSYMSMHVIPKDTQALLRNYLDFSFARQGGMLQEKILNKLPTKLVQEMICNFHQYVEPIPFFSPSCRPVQFISEITGFLEMRMYTPGTIVIAQQTRIKEILILRAGGVALRTPEKQLPLWTLVPFDYLGDFQVLYGGVFEWQAVATSLADMLALSRKNILKVLSQPHYSVYLAANDAGAKATIQRHYEQLSKAAHLQRKMDTTKIARFWIGASNRQLQRSLSVLRISKWHWKFFTIPHDSGFQVWWGLLCLSLCIYLAIALPLRVAVYWTELNLDKFFFPRSLIADYVVDAIFLLDAYLNARVFQIQDLNSAIVSEPTEIMSVYLVSLRWKVDVVTLMPYDLFGLACGGYVFWRLSRAFRFLMLPVYITNSATQLEMLFSTKISATSLSVLNMSLLSLIVIHWVSCFWAVCYSEGHDILGAYYWTLTTITTVGYGDITPDSSLSTGYSIIIEVLGVMFWATNIAIIVGFIQGSLYTDENMGHRYEVLTNFLSKQQALTASARSSQTQNIVSYMKTLQARHGGINESHLFRLLPMHLRSEIKWCLAKDLLEKCEMFCGLGPAGPALRFSLAQLLEWHFYSKHACICRIRPATLGMYFIKYGSVLIVDSQFASVNELGPGCYFFRQALLEEWTSNPFPVSAQKNCELFLLKRSSFRKIMNQHPDLSKKLPKRGSINMGSPMRSVVIQTKLRSVAPADSEEQARRKSRSTSRSPLQSRRRKVSCLPTPETLMRIRRKKRVIWNPNQTRTHLWNMGIVCVTICNWILIPFAIGFGWNWDDRKSFSAFWFILDALLWLNSVLRAFFFSPDGIEEDHFKIFASYRQDNALWTDLVTVFPLYIFHKHTADGCFTSAQINQMLRLNRLFRIADFTVLAPAVQHWLSAKCSVSINSAARFIKLISCAMLSAHVFSCVFFFLAARSLYCDNDCESWAGRRGLLSGCEAEISCYGDMCTPTLANQYIVSLYWALATLTTVGYGDVSAYSTNERIFGILAIVGGTLVFTLAIANLSDIITQMDVTQSLFKSWVDRLNFYCKLIQAPLPLCGEAERYSQQLWLEFKGVQPTKLLNYLPKNMHTSLVLDLAGHLLEKLYFVKDHHPLVLEIASKLSFELCLVDQKLFFKGEPADFLFFLVLGKLTLENPEKLINYATLENCIVGESEFFSRDIHPCNGICQTQCQLFILDFQDFWEVLTDLQMTGLFQQYFVRNGEALSSLSMVLMIAKVAQNLNKGKLNKMMTEKKQEEQVELVFEPTSWQARWWSAVCIALTLYYTIAVPLGFAFEMRPSSVQVCLTALIDFFFLFDVYLNARHLARDVEGIVVKTRSEFGRLYIKDGEIWLDIVSALPISLFAYLCGYRCERTFGLFSLNNLLRILRLSKYGETIVKWVLERMKRPYKAKLARLFGIFVFNIVIVHIASCIHLLSGRMQTDAGHDNWMTVYGITDTTKQHQYLIAFFWTIYTVATVGYGSVPVVSKADHFFAMFLMVVGAMICDAGMVAVITSIIEEKDHEAGTFQRQLQCTQRYMHNSFFDESFTSAAGDFFQHTKNNKISIIEKEVYSELPFCLRRSFRWLLCSDRLRSSPIFHNFSDGLIHWLCYKIQFHVGLPGEVLLGEQNRSKDVYLLQEGDCRVIDSKHVRLSKVLPPGSVISSLGVIRLDGRGMCGLNCDLTLINASQMPGYRQDVWDRVVEVSFLGGKFRSSVKEAGEELIWNESYLTTVLEDDHILIAVYDVLKETGREILLGKASFLVEDCLKCQSCAKTLISADGSFSGEIRISLAEKQSFTGLTRTIACKNFCHMYRLKFKHIVRAVEYMHNLDTPKSDRFPSQTASLDDVPILNLPPEVKSEVHSHSLLFEDEEEAKNESSFVQAAIMYVTKKMRDSVNGGNRKSMDCSNRSQCSNSRARRHLKIQPFVPVSINSSERRLKTSPSTSKVNVAAMFGQEETCSATKLLRNSSESNTMGTERCQPIFKYSNICRGELPIMPGQPLHKNGEKRFTDQSGENLFTGAVQNNGLAYQEEEQLCPLQQQSKPIQELDMSGSSNDRMTPITSEVELADLGQLSRTLEGTSAKSCEIQPSEGTGIV